MCTFHWSLEGFYTKNQELCVQNIPNINPVSSHLKGAFLRANRVGEPIWKSRRGISSWLKSITVCDCALLFNTTVFYLLVSYRVTWHWQCLGIRLLWVIWGLLMLMEQNSVLIYSFAVMLENRNIFVGQVGPARPEDPRPSILRCEG